MASTSAFYRFVTHFRTLYQFNIKYKDESKLMQFLGFIVCLFNKRFMTNFTTRWGNTVYFPSREWVEKNELGASLVLAHELVHGTDHKRLNKKFPGLYFLSYAFPQILAIFSLLAFLAFIQIEWLCCLCFLGFLAPIPSPGRFNIEARGYAMNLFFMKKICTIFDVPFDIEDRIEGLTGYFTGSDYYFMWPFKEKVKKRLRRNLITAKFLSPVFLEVETWLRNEYGK